MALVFKKVNVLCRGDVRADKEPQTSHLKQLSVTPISNTSSSQDPWATFYYTVQTRTYLMYLLNLYDVSVN